MRNDKNSSNIILHEDHLPYTNPGSSTHKDIFKQQIHGMLSKCQQIHGLDPGHGRGVEGDYSGLAWGEISPYL